MNITPLQSSFANGAISGAMHERSETAGYASSVGKMLNVISIPQGPAYSRFPWVWRQEFDGFTEGRIETIQISANAFIAAVFLDLEIQFFTDSGAPLKSGFVQNSRFAQLGASWIVITDGNASSVVEFERHVCKMTPNANDFAFAGIKQNVTLTAPADIHVIYVSSNVEQNSDEIIIRMGTAEGLADIVDATSSTDVTEISFTPNTTDIWIEVVNEGVNGPGGNNTVNLALVDVYDDSAITSIPTPYLAADLHELQFIAAPSNNLVFITHHLYAPAFIQYNAILGTATFGTVTFTAEPPEWGEGNYPATGAVHKGRMWYANTLNEGEQLWASIPGDLTNFTYGTGEADAFSVVNEHFGAIQWMLSTKLLIFGAFNAEYLISSDGPTIFIGNIQIDRQSTYGSTGIRAIQAGDKVLYITADKIKLQAMQFDRDAQNWLSEQLSFPANSILRPGAQDFAWEQNPISLFWVVLEDGTMACMSYNRPMNIVGWHEHDTQGLFKSVAVGDRLGETLTIVLVDRGDGKLKLEGTSPDGNPMDSRITVELEPPGTTVTGLDHLEGFLCQVVTDGAVHPDRTVVGGEIELQWVSTIVQVGLGYRKQITTLQLDKGSNKGSARGYVKRYSKIYLSLINSPIPYVNGQIPPIRHPATPMGEIEPGVNGLVEIHKLGWSDSAILDIVQDGPIPLAVAAIYGEVSQDTT